MSGRGASAKVEAKTHRGSPKVALHGAWRDEAFCLCTRRGSCRMLLCVTAGGYARVADSPNA